MVDPHEETASTDSGLWRTKSLPSEDIDSIREAAIIVVSLLRHSRIIIGSCSISDGDEYEEDEPTWYRERDGAIVFSHGSRLCVLAENSDCSLGALHDRVIECDSDSAVPLECDGEK